MKATLVMCEMRHGHSDEGSHGETWGGRFQAEERASTEVLRESVPDRQSGSRASVVGGGGDEVEKPGEAVGGSDYRASRALIGLWLLTRAIMRSDLVFNRITSPAVKRNDSV